ARWLRRIVVAAIGLRPGEIELPESSDLVSPHTQIPRQPRREGLSGRAPRRFRLSAARPGRDWRGRRRNPDAIAPPHETNRLRRQSAPAVQARVPARCAHPRNPASVSALNAMQRWRAPDLLYATARCPANKTAPRFSEPGERARAAPRLRRSTRPARKRKRRLDKRKRGPN